MTTSARPRCHRGELLRAHCYEIARAAKDRGTRGIGPAGRRIIDESRGRLIRRLMERWGARRIVDRMPRIARAFTNTEARELYG